MFDKVVKKRAFIVTLILIVLLILLLISAVVFTNPIRIYDISLNSENTTEIKIPENIAYNFSEIQLDGYELYDELYVTGIDEDGKKCNFLRSYYINNHTNEEVIKSQRTDNGEFAKGYYIGKTCRCTYYKNGSMTLVGKKIGKVYTFDKGKLKNVSLLSSYDGIYGHVYVITYYNQNGKRIAVKTMPSAKTGNLRLKNFLYEKHYNSIMLPISETRFREIIG